MAETCEMPEFTGKPAACNLNPITDG